MPVTGSVLRDALAAVGAVGKQIRSLDELAAGLDGALRQAPPGLTVDGAASFAATQAQESAYLRTTREYGSGQRYAPFIGRTFEQVTWRENYAKFGLWCRSHGLIADSDAFVNNPGSLEEFRWAWLGGVWYFEANGLWRYANAGNHWAVSQGVNRGVGAIGTDKVPNGWSERLKMYDAFRAAGAALLPAGAPAQPPASAGGRPELHEGDTSELVWKLQRFMNRVFPAYSQINAGDRPPSRLGPQTVGVLTEFQRRSGIPTAPPFAVGPKTWAALEKSGFRD